MLKDTFHKNLGNAYKMQIEEIGFLMSVYGVAVRLAVFPIQFLGVQPLDELILIGVKPVDSPTELSNTQWFSSSLNRFK